MGSTEDCYDRLSNQCQVDVNNRKCSCSNNKTPNLSGCKIIRDQRFSTLLHCYLPLIDLLSSITR